MSQTITIAPVRKSVTVKTSLEHAFEVFTTGIGHWWPTGNTVGKAPMKQAVLEPRLGGRWYELAEDGSQAQVGEVLAWDPPARLLVGWRLNPSWQPDVDMESLVEVTFTAVAPGVTLVELEHRAFEVMEAEGGASMRKDVDGGWPGMLARFAAKAEGRVYEAAP
jgi:uncharacterized protein YndB with AHSA1/START domain